MPIALTLLLLFLLPLAAGLLLLLLRRRNRQALERLGEARQLERSADHVLHVAQNIHLHIGRSDIAHALLSLAGRFIERAALLAPRQPHNGELQARFEALEGQLRTEPDTPTVPRNITHGTERELNHTRFLLLEATRLLARLQREQLFERAELEAMSDVLQQTLRAVDLRLQLHAAMFGHQPQPEAEPQDSADRRTYPRN